MIKHLVIGLGLVGLSFLRIVKKQGLFDSKSFYCVDTDPKAKNAFISCGGDTSHFICQKFAEDNYQQILERFSYGDFILDFANEINNIEVLEHCLKNGLHYLTVADSYWNINDPRWVSIHQHYKAYTRLYKQYKHTRQPLKTSIIEFGMNPGMVSCFAKKCLEQIVESDKGRFISKRRSKLVSLLRQGKHSIVARRIRLRSIVEVDNDNQVFNIQACPGRVYSTWSPESFYHEELSAPELIFGTRREFWQFQRVRDCDFSDFYVSLQKNGIDCKEEVFSPQGMVVGALTTHEEIFSMSNCFKVLNYKPTSFFVYSPSSIAEQSVLDNRNVDPDSFDVLKREDWVCGGESVGVILQGERFQTAYFGNYLDSEQLDETATVLQVSASAFAAYKYILNHPDEGFLFPEDLDANEMLSYAEPYLKSYIFQNCPEVNPVFGNERFSQ